ncbi:hypothetical protein X777_01576 [Ooceraea biroi]|uniref:Uncharacterized protein n=1 Tax=Ooceraea biroi TaxID=2015173 RepID=A0A026WQ91_OOCBI|nr:hypothetical protein X777_01576 [Ooceraea biroi]
MRCILPGRGSRRRLFAGCAMMAECARTGCTVSSGSSIDRQRVEEAIARYRGGIEHTNQGGSNSSSNGNTCPERATG